MAATQDIGTLPPARQPAANAADFAKCDAAGCGEPATHSYEFDWGQKGVCCAKHSFLHQQTAQQIERRVAIMPLVAQAPVPLERDERTKLIAARLALESEIEESKARGLELYRSNVSLSQQVQTLTLQRREHEAQLKDRDARILQLQGALEERTAEAAELVAEVERLRTLESFVKPPTGPAELDETTVVDG